MMILSAFRLLLGFSLLTEIFCPGVKQTPDKSKLEDLNDGANGDFTEKPKYVVRVNMDDYDYGESINNEKVNSLNKYNMLPGETNQISKSSQSPKLVARPNQNQNSIESSGQLQGPQKGEKRKSAQKSETSKPAKKRSSFFKSEKETKIYDFSFDAIDEAPGLDCEVGYFSGWASLRLFKRIYDYAIPLKDNERNKDQSLMEGCVYELVWQDGDLLLNRIDARDQNKDNLKVLRFTKNQYKKYKRRRLEMPGKNCSIAFHISDCNCYLLKYDPQKFDVKYPRSTFNKFININTRVDYSSKKVGATKGFRIKSLSDGG